ncbi:MAG TPA: hypothetical protein VF765_26420 [Polyangiaceae bacterium]
MGIIRVPPYVLAGETPPHHETSQRAFHLRSWELPEPVEFPRELFADALKVHARLLEEHGSDVLDEPILEPGEEPDYIDPGSIGFSCALLASRGTTVEIHRWHPQEVSFLVQRCRGIVRRLMTATELDRMHVVVVAEGAASLHLVRAHAPRRVGDRPRMEVVERALVVEPWEQYHLRVRGSVITTWMTPAGDLAASRVAAPPKRWTVRAIADALVSRYEASARAALTAFRQEYPRAPPAVHLSTEVDGEELHVVHRRDLDPWVQSFPALLREAQKGLPGFDPMVVDACGWAALVWLATGTNDAAKPAPRFEWAKEVESRPGTPLPDLVHVPHRGEPVPKPRRNAPAPDPGPEYWRGSLAKSLSHLERLVDLRAPEPIIDAARETSRKRIAKLEPGDVEVVLRAWPRAARLLAKGSGEARSKPDADKPN